MIYCICIISIIFTFVCYFRTYKSIGKAKVALKECETATEKLHDRLSEFHIACSREERSFYIMENALMGKILIMTDDNSVFIRIKAYHYETTDPDDREFAYNEAKELCDKLNEKTEV